MRLTRLILIIITIIPLSTFAFITRRISLSLHSTFRDASTTNTIIIRNLAVTGKPSVHDNNNNNNNNKELLQEEQEEENEIILFGPPDRDAMIARAGVLRQSILKQQLELQQLERDILCVVTDGNGNNDNNNNNNNKNNDNSIAPLEYMARTAFQARSTFLNSTDVLRRKLNRVRGQVGKNNKKYSSVNEYVTSQTVTGVRIGLGLLKTPDRLKHLADPNTAALVPHIPALFSRLDRLEPHVASILEKVLNNKQHLGSIEPYLDQVLDRFDDIEPHFPWILKHIDILAPYTGLLLKHIDELLLYAESDDDDDNNDGSGSSMMNKDQRYDLAEQLLPYLEFYVSRLDLVGPHLPLLRPHVSKLLKRNRIAKITPHVDRLFARGYMSLGTSANLDILLFWLGWTLSVPLLPRIFFAIPGSPKFVSFLANRLPRRFARKCSSVTCSLDGDYGSSWNRLSKD